MNITVPHQKTVIVHRDMPKRDFLQIKDENWMDFNKKFGPYALQLYLYLADNRDDFPLALSQQAAENEAGITKTTFHKYVNLLIDEGYLVHKSGNTYDFYERPHKQEKNDLACPPCGKLTESQQEQQNLSHKSRNSFGGSNLPQSNKEINNIDITDNIQINPDNPHQYEEKANSIAESEWVFNF